MNAVIVPPNAAVLRNRGFQLRLCRLARDDNNDYIVPYTREYKDDLPVTDLVWFNITNADVAVIEEAPPQGFGTLEGWETALSDQPYRTVAMTIAISLDMFVPNKEGLPVPNIKLAANLLMEGKIADYAIAVTNAMMMAQGISPEVVGESAKRTLAQAQENADKAMERMLEIFRKEDTQTSQTDDSPSNSGTQDGPSLEETQTSSGDLALHR